MNKLVRPVAIAAWLLLGLLPLYVLTRAQGQDAAPTRAGSNINGNVNSNTGNALSTGSATNTGVASHGGSLNLNMNRGVGPGPEAVRDEEAAAAAILSAEWRPAGELTGYATVSPLVLRSGAASDSPARRVEVEELEGVTILAAEGGRLRVRIEPNAERGGARARAIEGWVEWGPVLPYTHALVLDARSGKLLRRVPLQESIKRVLFAPDGANVLFQSDYAVYEADAKEFQPRRFLELGGVVTTGELFWQGSGGSLIVPVWWVSNDARGNYSLAFLRVGEGPAARTRTGIAALSEGRFLVSRDGQTAYALYRSGEATWGSGQELVTVEVFNLQTLTAVRSFSLPDFVTWDSEIIVGSGAELLVLPHGESQSLAVFETMTGSLIREVPLNRADWATFTQPDGTSGATLLRISETGEDGQTALRSARIGPEGKLATASPDVHFAVEAGGSLYGLDEAGTRLFVLNEDYSVRSARDIKPRAVAPRVEEGGAPEPVVRGLFASPDGARVIIIFGVPECGC